MSNSKIKDDPNQPEYQEEQEFPSTGQEIESSGEATRSDAESGKAENDTDEETS